MGALFILDDGIGCNGGIGNDSNAGISCISNTRVAPHLSHLGNDATSTGTGKVHQRGISP